MNKHWKYTSVWVVAQASAPIGLEMASSNLHEVLTDVHKVPNEGRPQVISSKSHKNYFSPKATL